MSYYCRKHLNGLSDALGGGKEAKQMHLNYCVAAHAREDLHQSRLRRNEADRKISPFQTNQKKRSLLFQ